MQMKELLGILIETGQVDVKNGTGTHAFLSIKHGSRRVEGNIAIAPDGTFQLVLPRLEATQVLNILDTISRDLE